MAGQGQALLPMLQLHENAKARVDELISEAARADKYGQSAVVTDALLKQRLVVEVKSSAQSHSPTQASAKNAHDGYLRKTDIPDSLTHCSAGSRQPLAVVFGESSGHLRSAAIDGKSARPHRGARC